MCYGHLYCYDALGFVTVLSGSRVYFEERSQFDTLHMCRCGTAPFVAHSRSIIRSCQIALVLRL